MTSVLQKKAFHLYDKLFNSVLYPLPFCWSTNYEYLIWKKTRPRILLSKFTGFNTLLLSLVAIYNMAGYLTYRKTKPTMPLIKFLLQLNCGVGNSLAVGFLIIFIRNADVISGINSLLKLKKSWYSGKQPFAKQYSV